MKEPLIELGLALAVGVMAISIVITGNLIAENISKKPEVVQDIKIYEDGSFVGCLKGGLCED